ncbi:MAG: SDR family NAD(P)-dependent oxidoreductase [Candidatus Gracilibacteria bacterium]|nr:SDR family NAD(P)-dependent oxidoreductase [Candidatus Gracilibacteria bacterium]
MSRVIITGGSEGLGLELSKLFLEKGFEVICLSRKKPEIDVIHIETNLTDEKSIQKTIDKIKTDYREFNCLINCAGVMDIADLGNIDYKKTEKLFKINVLAPIIITSELIDLIKQNESDIVNIGSTVGFKAYEKQCSYGASKWAIRGINENLQLELKKTKCRVIGFNPGGFKSKIVEKATGIKPDLSPYMEPKELAKLLIQILELPKNMEVSEIIINRK